MPLECFQAYDVRAKVPEQLDNNIAYHIGWALGVFLQAKTVVVGRDPRPSGESLESALCAGLIRAGAQPIRVGLCGTEEIYFAVNYYQADGGAMITASHNPPEYNGIKMVRKGALPISAVDGLATIRTSAEGTMATYGDYAQDKSSIDKTQHEDYRPAYIKHLLSYIDSTALRPLKIVCNAGNGRASAIVDLLEPQLPFEWVKMRHEANGYFEGGVLNPMLADHRKDTIALLKKEKADLGLAWDTDFDRCFFFDEQGTFIEGYYLVGLLAEYFLNIKKLAPSAIIHDTRLLWNTQDLTKQHGGRAVACRCGHSFIKTAMRNEDAVYGGEMSGHHYFRDFAYCDSGMIPWLIVTQMISISQQPLSALVRERQLLFPVSGEISRRINVDVTVLMDIFKERYMQDMSAMDETDGLSFEFADWRFNIRASNTEPLVRLNVETRNDAALLAVKTKELLGTIEQYSK